MWHSVAKDTNNAPETIMNSNESSDEEVSNEIIKFSLNTKKIEESIIKLRKKESGSKENNTLIPIKTME